MNRSLLASVLISCLAVSAFGQAAPTNQIHIVRPYAGQKAALASVYTMTYNGGPIINSGPMTVYTIFYGSAWTQTQRQIVNNFLHHLGGTKTYNIDAGYFDGTGTKIPNSMLHDSVLDATNTAYPHGKNLSDAQIQQVVADAIKKGKLPVDKNGLYVVMTDPTVTSSALGGFCVTQCGYHFNSSTIAPGNDIKYAFVGNAGNLCPQGCSAPVVIGDSISPNSDIGIDGAISVLWHELSEAVTDPDPNSAWTDPTYSEIGDECAWQFGNLRTLANGSHANQHIGARDYLIQLMPLLSTTKVGPDTWETTCVQRTK